MERCGTCAHWEPHGPRDMDSVTSGDCQRLKDYLYFTYYHPPYAGGSMVDSVETQRDFGCTLHEPLPAPAPAKEPKP